MADLSESEIAERVASAAAAVRAAVGGARLDHPAHEEIVAYVDARLDETAGEAIDAHLDLCAACREDVADLRAVAAPASAQHPARTPAWAWYLGAGLAAAAVLAGVMIRPSGGVAPAPAPAAIVLALKDGDRAVTLDEAGRLGGVPALSAKDRDAVLLALRTSRVDVPEAIRALRGRPGALLGAPATAALFGPISPLSTAVASAQPVFAWTAQPQATAYVVSVFDADLKKVAESATLRSLTWTPPAPLGRGVTYTWQVRARVAGEDVIAPRPPAPEAKFLVLSQEDADGVTALRRAAAGSPLVLGILLARAGLIDDAAGELQRLGSENPSSSLARQLLDSLR